jgi:hypothetical protein
MQILGIVFLLVLAAANADRATYNNYQVRRVVPENQDQLEVLKELENSQNGVRLLHSILQ